MHGRGIVHRDIKTENILIDGDGYCLLADMGLAAVCALEDREQKGHTSLWPSAPIGKRENHLINPKDGVVVRRNRTSFMGTPEYMCPEMILKKTRAQPNPPPLSYNLGCDWWACGILLCAAAARMAPGLLPNACAHVRDAVRSDAVRHTER